MSTTKQFIIQNTGLVYNECNLSTQPIEYGVKLRPTVQL